MSVFNGYLLMGYATIFTMAPVFSLVLDEDHREDAIAEFPQLYKELLKSRAMNTRSFLQWVWVSFFQGGVMMYLTLQLFSDEMFQIVSIAFTALLITELVIVAGGVHFKNLWKQRKLHFWLFIAAECFSLLCFFLAVLFLPDTFDKKFFFSWVFAKKVGIICISSIGPIFILWAVGKYVLFRSYISQLH
jgi:phospholipid-translocating ATPase